MFEKQIEELKDAIRQVMELIISRGAPISEEVRNMLYKVMEHVANRIGELRNQQQLAQITPSTELPSAPFESSNINAFKYDDKTGNLLVKFQDKYPGTNGPIYSYSGVPKFIFEVFKRGAVGPKTSGRNAWIVTGKLYK